MAAELPVSAAFAAVAEAGRWTRWAAVGVRAPDDSWPPSLSSRFDLASLTKPVVATLALRLDRLGVLPLHTRIGDVAAGAHRHLARRQLVSLLRHRSGLVAWTPLSLRSTSSEGAQRLLLAGGAAGELLGARPGTYSDLGYMLWGMLASRVTGVSLAGLLHRQVTVPLGMRMTRPSPGPLEEVVACGLDNGVEVRLAAEQGLRLRPAAVMRRGTVQDANARFLGGLGGHAGLFSSPRDLLILARAWLAPDGTFLDAESVEQAHRGRGAYALGWARRRVRGSAGSALSPSAFGHTGFTGTSLWLDPIRDRVCLLLAHRRHSNSEMNPWRRRFHALASSARGDAAGSGSSS